MLKKNKKCPKNFIETNASLQNK